MLTYVEQMLTRLENAVDGHHVIVPRQLNPGDVTGLIVMVITHNGREMGLRADKINQFLDGVCKEHLNEIQIGMGLTLLRILEPDNGHVTGEAICDKALWEKEMGDAPFPDAPVFKTVKHQDTLKYDYQQSQNFLWESTDFHSGNLVNNSQETPYYLDLEYFIYTLLSDPQNFDHSSRIIVSFLMHHLKTDNDWGEMTHARLIKMRYKVIFISNNLSSTVH